jgi:pimeloyl-ACP methyl ester carboxylesterase
MINTNPNFLLNHIAQGSGPTVILIHGMGASRHDWSALIPQLVSAGYRVYAVDLLGHGDSPKPNSAEYYTVQQIYKSLENWLFELQPAAPYHLVGHSLGGYMSLELALTHPDKVTTTTLIDPLYTSQQLNPILRYLSRSPELGIKLLPRVPHNLIETVLGWDPVTSSQFSPQARLQTAMDIKRASPHILNIPRSIIDLTQELTKVEQPSQVIWGNKDQTLSPHSFAPLVSAIPNASGHMLSGTGHQPHIGMPETVNSLILDFIRTHNNHHY